MRIAFAVKAEDGTKLEEGYVKVLRLEPVMAEDYRGLAGAVERSAGLHLLWECGYSPVFEIRETAGRRNATSHADAARAVRPFSGLPINRRQLTYIKRIAGGCKHAPGIGRCVLAAAIL